MPAAFFRRKHCATARPKRREEIAQHKRHYCGAVRLAVGEYSGEGQASACASCTSMTSVTSISAQPITAEAMR